MRLNIAPKGSLHKSHASAGWRCRPSSNLISGPDALRGWHDVVANLLVGLMRLKPHLSLASRPGTPHQQSCSVRYQVRLLESSVIVVE